jgi:serine/threonine-protein kinase ATR
MNGINMDVVKRNRVNAISLLKSVSEKNLIRLSESCMMAWAELGRYAVSLRIIEYKLTG